jgi:hypothetical protein
MRCFTFASLLGRLFSFLRWQDALTWAVYHSRWIPISFWGIRRLYSEANQLYSSRVERPHRR